MQQSDRRVQRAQSETQQSQQHETQRVGHRQPLQSATQPSQQWLRCGQSVMPRLRSETQQSPPPLQQQDEWQQRRRSEMR